jgi:phosphatidylinositol glycan class F
MAPAKQDTQGTDATATSSSAPSSSAAKGSPALHPVALLDTPLAGLLANIRPVALLGLLFGGFRWLVSDPENALQMSLPVAAAIQAAYAVLCLPATGSPAARKQRPGEKKKSDGAGPNPVVVSK